MNNIAKPIPSTAELTEAITPYLLKLFQEHPQHGVATLKVHFRDSRISLIKVKHSASFLPDSSSVVDIFGGK